jgi:hypothetical protein
VKTSFASLAGCRRLWLSLAAVVIATALPVHAEQAAVSTRVFNSYKRTRLADGSFKPETYAFANAGCFTSIAGDTISDIPFRQIAGTIAAPMAQRGYYSASDPEKTDLLIFIGWGTTDGSEPAPGSSAEANLNEAMRRLDGVRQASTLARLKRTEQAGSAGNSVGSGPEELSTEAMGGEAETFFTMVLMEQRAQDRQDLKNAMLLGFEHDFARAHELNFTSWSRDFLSDLRVDRYYVVVKAYDFQLAWKKKQKKILWEARFSVARPGTNFAEVLPSMAQYASRFFGQDSKGLIRDRLPEVKIIYGDAKMIKYEPGK